MTAISRSKIQEHLDRLAGLPERYPALQQILVAIREELQKAASEGLPTDRSERQTIGAWTVQRVLVGGAVPSVVVTWPEGDEDSDNVEDLKAVLERKDVSYWRPDVSQRDCLLISLIG